MSDSTKSQISTQEKISQKNSAPESPPKTPAKEFVGLSDKLKLHFIKLSEKMSTLDLIEAIEFELRERNKWDPVIL